MVVVKLKGGLGNQMFQFAVGFSICKRFETKLFLDHSFLEIIAEGSYTQRNFALSIFKLKNERFKERDLSLFFNSHGKFFKLLRQFKIAPAYKVALEPHYHFAENLFISNQHYYLDGYWQSPLYFKGYEELLKKEFQFRNQLLNVSHTLAVEIRNSVSVCVQIRRGDFLSSDFHMVCSPKYYLDAMDYIRGKLNNPQFYIFTDDDNWARQFFGSLPDVQFIDAIHNGEHYGNKFQLMTICKHFIISNSTYGWWAVWLANYPDAQVVVPKKWYKIEQINTNELLSPHWHVIEND